MGFETWTDPILSFVGAAGGMAYIAHIHRDRSRSYLELMMLVLLYCLAALFISRGFYWLTEDEWLQVPSFVPATLLPLAVALFVEALMRRHVRPAFKVFVAVGTLVCFVLNLVPLVSREDLWTISRVVTLGTFGWLALLVAFRDRTEHAPMENRLINGVTTALAFAFVLALTDLQIAPSWLHFRVGGIGGLIFVYVCVRLTDPDESWVFLVRELFWVGAGALVVTSTFAVLAPDGATDFYVAIFFVSFSFVLLFTILERLRGLRRDSYNTSFFRWLLNARTGSIDDFIDSLYRLPLAREHLIVRGSDLDLYEPEEMADVLDGADAVCTLSSLRAGLVKRQHDREGTEQLIGLLEQNGMTHIALLSQKPYAFLLLNLPQFTSTHNPMLEMALLQKYARLLSPG
jgi:hypothetical protein